VWLKGKKSFWQIPLPQTCSWRWKKILKLYIPLLDLFSVPRLVMVLVFFLWYETWHPAGCLIEKYGFKPIYDAGHSIGPMMSSITRNGEWFWNSVRSDSLVKIQSRLPEIPIGTADILVWNSSKGTYSCSESWNLLRLKFPVVDWLRVVWFPLAIPTHFFILWLAVRDALTTKDKLCSWGFTSSSLCLFCYGC
jgi:hypothetical protein